MRAVRIGAIAAFPACLPIGYTSFSWGRMRAGCGFCTGTVSFKDFGDFFMTDRYFGFDIITETAK